MTYEYIYDGNRARRPDHVKRLDHVKRPDHVKRQDHVKGPDRVERLDQVEHPVRVTAYKMKIQCAIAQKNRTDSLIINQKKLKNIEI